MKKLFSSNGFKLFIKLALGVLVFWFLSKKIDFSRLPSIFYAMNYGWLFAALLFQFLSTFISGFRWKIVMNTLGFHGGFMFYQKLYFEGFFFSQALPGSVGGDAIRLLGLADEGYSTKESLYGIFIDRVAGLAGLLLISLVALLFAPSFLGHEIKETVFLIGSCGLLGFGVLLFIHKILASQTNTLFRIIAELSHRFYHVYETFGRFSIQTLLSVAIHFCSILSVYAISLAAGLHIGFGAFLCLMPLVILLTILPLSFAGWGVREGAMAGLFGMSGAPKEVLVAVSITYGIILICSSLPGFIAWLESKNIA